jgi:uncharacterized BrkB/YihY/UPF0761 family membrane protein
MTSKSMTRTTPRAATIFGLLQGLSVDGAKAPRMAAVLSYGTAFSMAPLLILAISIAGPVLGDDAAQEEDQSTSRTIDTLRPLETRFMIPHSNKLLGKAPHHGVDII